MRTTSSILSCLNIYTRSLSLVTYTTCTALFARMDICSMCPKRRSSNCVGQDYCETPLYDIQVANSINTRSRGEQWCIQVNKLETISDDRCSIKQISSDYKFWKHSEFSGINTELFTQTYTLYIQYILQKQKNYKRESWKNHFFQRLTQTEYH